MKCHIKDISIHYEEVGSGRPLLALHGWRLDHRHMQSALEPIFADREGWRRIYPDLPGMGETRGKSWITNQDHVLDIVLAFIEAVAPEEHFAVAGTSYGGYLARGLVHRIGTNIDGLFLNVPQINPSKTKAELPKHTVLKEDAKFKEALEPDELDVLDSFVVQNLSFLQEYRRWFLPAIAAANDAFLERLHKNYSYSFDVDVLTEPFPAPSLILAGRFDNWCGYQDAFRLLDNYPRATYAVLDRTGHDLALEQELLYRILAEEWLSRVEEYAEFLSNSP